MESQWIKITFILLCFYAANAWADYYRYKDKDGHIVIGTTLPPEMADHGYQIIGPRGNVIQTVDPRESEAEIKLDTEAELKEKEKAKQAEFAQKQAEMQVHKDEILLKSFSSEADIARSRDEKIASIKVLEEIVHENITRLEKQLKDTQSSIASYEQAKKSVPDNLKKTVEETERQIKENQAFLERKKSEINEINTKYQGLIDRFQKLQSHTSDKK